MPVQLTIDHTERLVIAIAEGPITPDEVQRCLAQVVTEKAIPYGKLIDLTFAPLVMRAAGIRAISERVVAFNQGQTPGPLAVVVTSELAKEMIELFDQQVKADRPLGIFTDLPSARAWLDDANKRKK